MKNEHAIKRAKERYGIELDADYVINKIKANDVIVRKKITDSRSFCIVSYGDMVLPVIYSSRGFLVTVLPNQTREGTGLLKFGELKKWVQQDISNPQKIDAAIKSESPAVRAAAEKYKRNIKLQASWRGAFVKWVGKKLGLDVCFKY